MRLCTPIVLLAVFGFALIAPLVPPIRMEPARMLPPRRRASLAMAMDDASANGVVPADSAAVRCIPAVRPLPAGQYAAVLTKSVRDFSAVISHPANHVQTEACYRISFSRSSQKRGPPVVLSLTNTPKKERVHW